MQENVIALKAGYILPRCALGAENGPKLKFAGVCLRLNGYTMCTEVRKSWTALVLALALLSEDNLRNKDPEMIFWGLYREALTPKYQL